MFGMQSFTLLRLEKIASDGVNRPGKRQSESKFAIVGFIPIFLSPSRRSVDGE